MCLPSRRALPSGCVRSRAWPQCRLRGQGSGPQPDPRWETAAGREEGFVFLEVLGRLSLQFSVLPQLPSLHLLQLSSQSLPRPRALAGPGWSSASGCLSGGAKATLWAAAVGSSSVLTGSGSQGGQPSTQASDPAGKAVGGQEGSVKPHK